MPPPSDKRQIGRNQVAVSVTLLRQDLAGTLATTRDISPAGALIEKTEAMNTLQVGEELELSITGLMGSGPRTVSATVTRIDEDALALAFKQPL